MLTIAVWYRVFKTYGFMMALCRMGLGLVACLSVVVFAFGGIEIIGITAGESQDPKTTLPKAINAVPVRILLFYVLTIFVLMSIFPWNQIGSQGSPFYRFLRIWAFNQQLQF